MLTPSSCARLSARRRTRYRRRSHSSGSRSGRAMSPCQITGLVARALSPRLEGSTGTARHSSSRRPRLSMASATIPRARSSQANSAATANSPPRRRCGTWISRPAPSPLLPSASRPPRCARRARAWAPRATASWPSPGVATKPIPQAARAVGRSPGQARRDRRSAGGTDLKAIGIRPDGLVSY